MIESGPVLITGAYGQLGWEISRLAGKKGNAPCLCVDYDTLDVTNREAVLDYCRIHRPSFIINCAAYTSVDKAEEEQEAAFAVNEAGVKNLALGAAELDASFIHISTDFVFDGSKTALYGEDDVPNPLGIYGQSKLAGERAALETHEKSLVIRTSWLYSSHGTNFVRTILGAAKKHGHLRVVCDQVGTPTYAADLAGAILRVLEDPARGYGHVFHYSNEGVASWYDFATAIVNLARIGCAVDPVETFEYPTPAKRPAYTVLNKKKIRRVFGLTIPHWLESLEQCMKEIER